MNTKKADMPFILVLVIITTITFALLLTVTNQLFNITGGAADNAVCRASLETAATADFFQFSLNVAAKCPFEKIDSPAVTKENTFTTLSERSISCWNKFGSGQKQFMSSYSSGQMCFVCSKIDFSDAQELYDYSEYITWLNTATFTQNGQDNLYRQAFNLKYSNLALEDIQELEALTNDLYTDLIFDTGQDGTQLTSSQKLLINAYYGLLLRNIVHSYDQLNKKIDTSETTYIVYRYDQFKQDDAEHITKATRQAVLEEASQAATNAIWTTLIVSAVTAGSGTLVQLSIQSRTYIGIITALLQISELNPKASEKLASVSEKLKASLQFTQKPLPLSATEATSPETISAFDQQYIDIMTEEEYYRTCGI